MSTAPRATVSALTAYVVADPAPVRVRTARDGPRGYAHVTADRLA